MSIDLELTHWKSQPHAIFCIPSTKKLVPKIAVANRTHESIAIEIVRLQKIAVANRKSLTCESRLRPNPATFIALRIVLVKQSIRSRKTVLRPSYTCLCLCARVREWKPTIDSHRVSYTSQCMYIQIRLPMSSHRRMTLSITDTDGKNFIMTWFLNNMTRPIRQNMAENCCKV